VAGHTELERKYDADADFALPDLTAVPECARVGEPETHTLVACYFDTPDLRLAAHGITLRRRRGGNDAGWHLKLPAAKNTKREIRAPLGESERDVPAELAALVAAHVRGRPLAPVAELETRRTERGLLTEDGQVLAELADDTVRGRRLGAGGGGASAGTEGAPTLSDATGAGGTLTWREIEIEAVNCTDDLLGDFGTRLQEAGARTAAVGSKLARVLGADLPAAERPAATGTAGEILIGQLDGQFQRLLTYDPMVRLADHDDDSVHKMRVATRRMRSLLRTHRPLLDRARSRALETELKWLADALGEVRDLEVLRVRCHEQLGELPGAHRSPAWLIGMAAAERRARDQLRRALLTKRYFNLLDSLEAFLAEPPLTSRAGRGTEQTAKVVAKAGRTMVRRYAEAERLPAGERRDTALHRTRKAAKRARYAAEAAGEALGTPAKKLARRAERLQEILGAHHDGVTAAQHLTRVAGRPGLPASDVFTLGRLTELQRRKQDGALRRLPAAARKASRRKLTRALRPDGG
jgi:CHAD domain-containing protein